MSWQQTLDERQELVLSTSSLDGVPHAIIALSLGLVDGKVLIGVCLMKTTVDNIAKNNKLVIIAKANEEYYQITGTAEMFSTGKYFDLAFSKSKPPMPKSTILVTISEIFDIGNQKSISLD